MKKKIAILVIIGLILGVFISRQIKLSALSSLLTLRNDLQHSYYNQVNLEEAIKEHIGGDYTGDIVIDYNNYVISLILEDLKRKESVKWEKYNQYLSNEEIDRIEITRKQDEVNNQSYEIDPSIWYVRIDSFREGMVDELFVEHEESIISRKKLLIDLRYSSGGLISEYLDLAGLFCEKGTQLLRVEGQESKIYYSETNAIIANIEVYIITSEETFSVAEQFTAVLKDYGISRTIGEVTYGKNIQASIRELKGVGGYVFISGVMYTPNGSTYFEGVEPDIYIEDINEKTIEEILDFIEGI